MTAENPIRYEGIQRVGITTSGHLFNPEETFALTHEVNKRLPSDMQMEIEVYTPRKRFPFTEIQNTVKKFGAYLPLPQGISTKDVEGWLHEYPQAKISRVHLPFDYNNEELLAGFTKFMKKKEVMTATRQALWWIYFGGAENMHGVEMAQQLGVGINAHANVITGLALDNRLDDIKKNVPFIITEVEEKHSTPLLHNEDAFGVPSVAIEEIVEKHNLNGILLGIDHTDNSVDLKTELQQEKVRQYTKAMHLSGENHEIFDAKSGRMKEFLAVASTTPFYQKVDAALDLNPLKLNKLSGNQQITLLEKIVYEIMESQPRSASGMIFE